MVCDLDATCTQEQFGQIVGIGQSAVSDLMKRGVLRPGDRAGAWLVAYVAHLREGAAGRGADGELARERTRLASAQAERVERQNQITAGQYAPIDLIEAVFATMGRRIASTLERIPIDIHRQCPDVPQRALDIIRVAIGRSCDEAVNCAIALLDVPDETADEADDDAQTIDPSTTTTTPEQP